MGRGETYPNPPLCLPQNGGNLLCAVDESNDHVLSVWDWAKESKVVDSKVSWLAAHVPSCGCPLRTWWAIWLGSATRLILNGGFGVICWVTVGVGCLLWNMRSTVVSSLEVERLGIVSMDQAQHKGV